MFDRLTPLSDLPPGLALEIRRTQMIASAYLAAVNFIMHGAARDPGYLKRNLLGYLSQDLLQSTISIPLLVIESLGGVAKRELRFLLETSCKLCLIEQKGDQQIGVADKLSTFAGVLDSSRMPIKELSFSMFDEVVAGEFRTEIGRVYGYTSNYVHLTHQQVSERIAASEAGRFAGQELPGDVAEFNRLFARIAACSLVLIPHAVESFIAGDWLIETDGRTTDTFFAQSRFIAAIDEHFDYKAERQDRLSEVKSARESAIRF